MREIKTIQIIQNVNNVMDTESERGHGTGALVISQGQSHLNSEGIPIFSKFKWSIV